MMFVGGYNPQKSEMEGFGQKMVESMPPGFSELMTRLGQTDIPEREKSELLESSMLKLAEKAALHFKGPLTKEIFESPEFARFFAERFFEIMSALIQEGQKHPRDTIAECGVNEAVFTHAEDSKPIAATDSLATCVGIAGCDSERQMGFVTHIATDEEFEASKEMLIDRIKVMAKTPIEKPIEIHLRGGIRAISEPLVAAIKKWVECGAENGCPMKIVSEVVLTKRLMDESGKPHSMSISLDTRTAAVSDYDSEANPYSKQKVQINNAGEAEQLLFKAYNKVSEKPEIKVVYFATK
jgi:hypothetical protein